MIKAAKILFAVIFLLSIGLGKVFAQNMQFNIEFSNPNPQPGEQVEISFIAENAANLFYYGLEVGYEPAQVEFAGIQPGPLMGSNPLSIADNLNETTIGASVVRTSGTGEGDGEVVTLLFNISESAATGPLSFTVQNPDVRNGAGNPVAVIVPSGFTLNVQPESEDTRTVVFQVDMSVQRQNGNFDTGLNDVVYARGAFNGWSLDNPMTLIENDIYEAEVEVSGPQGQNVEYKFFIQAGDGRELTNTGWENFDGNRTFTLGEPDVMQVLDKVFFSNELPDQQPELRPVVFRVNLQYYIDPEIDLFNPSFMDVYVRGTFNNFGLADQMEVIDDAVYELTVMVPGNEGDSPEFKFFVFVPEEFEDDFPFPNDGWELLNDDPDLNRSFELGPAGQTQDLGMFFFNDMMPPEPQPFRPVSFFVDMSVQEQLGIFQPESGDEVFVLGSFNNSDFGELVPMLLTNNSVYTAMPDIFGNEGEEILYKFFIQAGDNRDLPNGGWEVIPDRSFMLGEAFEPQELPVVFFDDLEEVPQPEVREVVFSVDMSVQTALGNFTPGSDDVIALAGSFNDWSAVALSESGVEGIYSITLSLEGQEGASEFYKFVLNNDFELEGLDNRSFTLGPPDVQQVLPVVFYDDNDQMPEPEPVRPVTFSVNMSVQQASGFYQPEVGDAVWVGATFNDFEPVNQLTLVTDGVYSVGIDAEGDEGFPVEYKFFITAGDGRELPFGGFEQIGDSPTLNRVFDLGPDGEPQILPQVFFSDDEGEVVPEPQFRNVTFFVDMSVQLESGFYNPAAGDTVWVGGDFNGFQAVDFMNPAFDGVYAASLDVEGDEGAVLGYKFFITAGDGRELPFGGFEQIGDDPLQNRELLLGPENIPVVLDVVFFSDDEGEVVPEPEVRSVTFLVDMSVQQASGFYQPGVGDAVWVGATFNDFEPVNQMTFVADGVYSVGIDVEGDEGSPVEYKFFITAGDGRELPFGGFEQIGDSPTINRVFELGPDAEPQILPQVFFGDEEPVEPEIVIVWPGDTNNDGVVNEQDVLPLGIYWNLTGPARENASTEWAGQPAVVWEPLEATFADTDGSGLVNQTDLLAVGLNFGNTHGGAASESGPIAEQILPALQPGDRVLITLSAPSETLIQGLSYAFGVDGAAPENYMVSSYEIGSWGEVWQGTGRLIEFDTVREGTLSGARVHRGQTQAEAATELFSIEIDVIQPISAGAAFFVQRVAYVSEAASIENFETIVLDIEVQTGSSASDGTELPAFTQLHQNYPNPFNPTTNISFDLSEPAAVTIEVVNILGQRVAVLANREDLSAGSHVRVFDAGRLNSGVYLVRMTTGSESFTRKMMLVK
ncbi:MAG: T9SS type A sorting domain-containing protein [Balneolales bacterium]|nr:T9SS type A sorting domain-containing protein [Balneolales bacterium]